MRSSKSSPGWIVGILVASVLAGMISQAVAPIRLWIPEFERPTSEFPLHGIPMAALGFLLGFVRPRMVVIQTLGLTLGTCLLFIPKNWDNFNLLPYYLVLFALFLPCPFIAAYLGGKAREQVNWFLEYRKQDDVQTGRSSRRGRR